MQESDCFYLGTITRKHGLKGHFLIKLDANEPHLYYNLETFFVEIQEVLIPFFIKEIHPNGKDGLRVLFKDLTYPEDQLLQKKIFLPLTFLPKLQGNQFYFHEVIGYLLKEENTIVGEIIKINDTIPQALFIIKTLDLKEILIPIIKDWIIEVNRKEKYISMILPNGILTL